MSDTSLIFNLLAVDKATEKILGVKSAFGLLAVGAAAGAAVFADKSIKMAADFESATTRLITSAGETHANIDMVRKGILDMAGQVGDSAQTLATAMYTIESGGQHGADGLKVLQAAAEGAKAEGADLTTVADALTSTLQDYHLKASDSARVTSEMVAAVGAGKTTFEQFAGSLHSVLPIASSAGVSFEDISAAIASMTVHGMSAEQATQNLSDVIKHMIAPTGVQTKELGQLGVSSSDLSAMLGKRGLTGTLQDLSQLILSKMGPSGKVLLDTFNKSKDAANDVNVMVGKMPPNLQVLAKQFEANGLTLGDWRKALKALPPEQANLLQQFAALQNRATGFNDLLKTGSPAAQTYQDALRRVTGDATGLNTTLMLTGENTAYVNGALKTISGATTEAGGHVKGWSDIQQTFNQKLAEARAQMGALTIKIGNDLLPVAKDLIIATVSTVGWFEKHKTIAQTLAAVIGTAAAGFLLYKTYLIASANATKIATAAQWLFNIAMDANPIGLVVIAIGLLVIAFVYLWTHSAAFRNFWIGLWQDIWDFLKAVGSWFAGPFTDFFVAAWHYIAGAALWVWHNVLDPLWQAIARGIAFIQNIATSFANLWIFIWRNTIGAAILWMWHNVWDPAIHGIADGAVWLWSNVIQPVGSAIGTAFAAVGSAAMWLWHNAISPAVHGIAEAALWLWHNVISPVFGWIGSAAGVVAGAVRSAFSTIGGFIASAFSGAVGIVRGALNGVISVINNAIGGVNSIIGALNNIPGVSFPHMPSIPHLDIGGDVQRSGLAVIHQGERVTPAAQVSRLPSGGNGPTRLEVTFKGNTDGAMATAIMRLIRDGYLQIQTT